jgi:D-alanyl-D-alanine carboxypeptidase
MKLPHPTFTLAPHRALRTALIVTAAILLTPATTLAFTAEQFQAVNDDTIYYMPNETNLGCASSSGGGDTLAGHTLPAAHGGSGNEDPVDKTGHLTTNGDPVAYPAAAKLGQNYQDYYIAMRWRTNKWNWDGHTVPGPEDRAFYAANPRVLVTNPRTHRSIIAVVMESGPAPWTGADSGPGTPKQGWVNPQDGTPDTYKGRVSGFPPVAKQSLQYTQRMADGSGDDLTYSWAADQKAPPGPTNVVGGGDAGDVTEAGSCAGTVASGDFFHSTKGMPCPTDAGITDAGDADGYHNGQLIPIHLCKVNSTTVNVLIAKQLLDLYNLAKSQGHNLSGGGFRTMQDQINTRRANGCPDIYNSPNTACHPPTAKPGYSNHQMGLAVDFTQNGALIDGHGNSGFVWMSQNAAKFGLKNYPAEPWHWSVDGN